MKRYDTYKDSGVQWIGEIPSHWKEYRMKYLLSRSSAGVWGDDEKEDENDIVCFRIADFDYAHGILKFDNITYRNIQKNQLVGRMLSHGDLLIEKSGGGEATPVGRVVRYNYDGEATCSNFIHSISIKEIFSSNFLYYFFYSLYANKVNLLYFNQTTGIQNLKVGDYLSQSIFLPSKSEQRAIAEWLDVKCREIDKLIATQKRRIELLQELCQSIITRAVTRGINPDAPLCDTGIDWIGQIPSNWTLKRLKFISSNYKAGPFGSSLITSQLLPDGDILVYTPEHIARKSVELDNNLYLPNERKDEMSQFLVKQGDIIFPIVGSLGRAMQISSSMPVGIINQRLAKFTIDECLDDRFFMWVFAESDLYNYYIKQYQRGSVIVNLTKDIVGNILVPIPPKNEQREIVAYLERETGKVDHALQQAERQIELLQELRQSVITEVVTGKRKVC